MFITKSLKPNHIAKKTMTIPTKKNIINNYGFQYIYHRKLYHLFSIIYVIEFGVFSSSKCIHIFSNSVCF